MKLRILSQLYGISRRLPKSRGYLDKVLADDSRLTEMMVVERAGQALHYLLHNYHYFRVETIDSFFQSILRNLAHELDLTPNLRIGLNDRQVEEQAVDEMIDGLKRGDTVRNHIMSYIAENIDEDKGWNVIDPIKQFGANIFKDVYRDGRDELLEKMQGDFFERFIKEMRNLCTQAAATLKRDHDDFMKILDSHHLQAEDLYYKTSGIYGFFNKLKDYDFKKKTELGVRILNCLQSPSAWVSAKHEQREFIEMVAANELMPLLDRTLRDYDQCFCDYRSAKIVLKHINKLRLLGNIEDKTREINALYERFQLSDTQHILSLLIDESDSPFIFEKIGGRLDHIMIDEFQDTGTKQWRNFKVLLQECMSRETSQNLIVGDVKQSIYRWRSGDWRILNNIKDEFVDSDSRLDIRSLDTNYRSSENVIAFNNAFFEKAVEEEYKVHFTIDEKSANQLRHAYSDVMQLTKKDADRGGYIEITLFPKPQNRDNKTAKGGEGKDNKTAAREENVANKAAAGEETTDSYDKKTLAKIVDIVDELSAKGVDESKMAILVRENKLIPIIADYFSQHRPHRKLVSDEAFRLDSSPSVNIIVAAMKYIHSDKDRLNIAMLVNLYNAVVLKRTDTLDEIMLSQGCELTSLLPEDIVANREEIKKLSLSDMTERIFKAFDLQAVEGQTEYVCAFYDQLSKFLDETNPSLHAFVKAWEEEIHKVTIQDTAVNGIRILTIHKSKGLEFDHVIMPFCNWKLEHTNNNTIWVKPRKAPFDQLPFIPVDYSGSSLVNTIFEEDYNQEHLQNRVDNLNLLYVAFTRAKSSLYIIGSSQTPGSRSELIENCLADLCNTLKGAVYDDGIGDGNENGDGTVFFSWGEHCLPSSDNEDDGDEDVDNPNVFLQTPSPIFIDIDTSEHKVEFRQSNDSKRFIEGLGENEENRENGEDKENKENKENIENNSVDNKQNDYIKTGTLLHRLFSSIRTIKDIEPALKKMQMEGVLGGTSDVERIHSLLQKRLTDKRIADWFSPRWTLYNECKIYYKDSEGKITECRPDRVMTDGNETIVVDFKFGKPYPVYRQQVEGYMNLLKQMGMPSVKGYIWYVYTNKIEAV